MSEKDDRDRARGRHRPAAPDEPPARDVPEPVRDRTETATGHLAETAQGDEEARAAESETARERAEDQQARARYRDGNSG